MRGQSGHDPPSSGQLEAEVITEPLAAEPIRNVGKLESLVEGCINGVRLVCWNIGGLAKRYHDILALRQIHGIDLICVQEIGNVDPVLLLSLRHIRGFQYARIWYCARPGGKGGGVAFISLYSKNSRKNRALTRAGWMGIYKL